MNMNYGKLVGGEVEYAPAKITLDDGTVVSNPSAATYLAAGWKRIVDERPAPEDGCTVEVSGWDETADSIVRIYKQVPDEPTPGKARVFSKLKLVAALKEADKWVLVKTWIEERGLWDYYLAAQNFREDNEMFSEALDAIKEYARMSDEDAEAILKNCIWEED
ncbi:MAG: hypothetical protein IJG13_21740 [Kiritimatiellae bacterium]|nr:hypothetical protein [Kiritimatiellia bacterium]